MLATFGFVMFGFGAFAAILAWMGCAMDGWPPWRRAHVPEALNRIDTGLFLLGGTLATLGIGCMITGWFL